MKGQPLDQYADIKKNINNMYLIYVSLRQMSPSGGL